MPANDDDSSTPGRGARRRVLGRGPGTTRLPAPGPGVVPEPELVPEPETVPEPEVVPESEAVPEAELVPEPETVPESELVHEPELGPPAELVAEADLESREPAGSGPEPAPEQPVPDDGRFKVRLANFEGPFDLLLQLISRHKLDVTEVALSKVTDEFMVHIRAMGPEWDLDQTTEFLVVAATLLDLKAARLLPTAEVEDEADLALLEARDLLFARLLQYRAYKKIADIFSGRLDEEARRYPRTVGLEPHHAELLPEVVISIGAEGFARLAVKAMQPRPKPQVYVDHIHAPLVSVREQAGLVVARLRELGEASFRVLVEDTDDTLTVVARFLALLELYREKAVSLEQEEALGELLVRWTGGESDGEPTVTDEFDRPPETAGKDGEETKAERGGAEEKQS
ncbi:segregation/condensation protein A [Streptomyces sp. NPDC055059]|uniref:segregation/condensation protein A n=1 Tax=Streptomyces sp. NPDC127172 TaxID=3345382 RepID=UPI003636D3C4